jgi:hypothetical protein
MDASASRRDPRHADQTRMGLRARSVWDHINQYWPEIAAKERRVTGNTPEKVEASRSSRSTVSTAAAITRLNTIRALDSRRV